MNLLIYGSGGVGKDVADLAWKINEVDQRWKNIYFIDDVRQEEIYYGLKILKFEQALSYKENSECVIGLGEPEEREKLFYKCKENGFHMATLIHPTANIAKSVKLGEGVIILSFTSLTAGAVIGDNVFIQALSVIGHDIQIGNHSVIGVNVTPGGYVKIGEKAYIGMGAKIMEKLSVGDRAIVGMGACVFRDVPDDMIVMGNPARVIRRNENHKVF